MSRQLAAVGPKSLACGRSDTGRALRNASGDAAGSPQAHPQRARYLARVAAPLRPPAPTAGLQGSAPKQQRPHRSPMPHQNQAQKTSSSPSSPRRPGTRSARTTSSRSGSAEQKKEKEEKKLKELQKQIDEERQLEELRTSQKDAGLATDLEAEARMDALGPPAQPQRRRRRRASISSAKLMSRPSSRKR